MSRQKFRPGTSGALEDRLDNGLEKLADARTSAHGESRFNVGFQKQENKVSARGGGFCLLDSMNRPV
jgi:hypothetical protein